MSKEIKAAFIGVIGAIIAAIIGAYFGAYFERKTDKEDTVFNVYETPEYISLKEKYDTLDYQKTNLENDKTDLQKQNNDLQNKLAEIPSLNQEIVSLREEIENLNQQITQLEGDGDQSESTQESTLAISKVSIFNLETFQGEARWYRATSKYEYTDTYDNEYKNAYYASHPSYNDPTYLLDKKYSICEGKIAWCKQSKDYGGSIWIDFYSGNDLIYSTDFITATDRVIDFSFPVDEVETLTIIRNTDRASSWYSVNVVYPYFNLIKK